MQRVNAVLVPGLVEVTEICRTFSEVLAVSVLPPPLALVVWSFVPDTHSQGAPLCVAVVTRCAEAAGGGSFRRIRP